MTTTKLPHFHDTRKVADAATFAPSKASLIDKRDAYVGEPRNRFERRVMASTKKKGKGDA